MNIEKLAKTTAIEYSILKENKQLCLLKLIFTSFIFGEMEKDKSTAINDLVDIYFNELRVIYQSSKQEILYYFEALHILEKLDFADIRNDIVFLKKETQLQYNLSEYQLRILNEIMKITDDAYVGMVIENV